MRASIDSADHTACEDYGERNTPGCILAGPVVIVEVARVLDQRLFVIIWWPSTSAIFPHHELPA